MAEVRIFSGSRVVADYEIHHMGTETDGERVPATEEQIISEARTLVVEDGHLSEEDAAAATYSVNVE